MSDQRTARVPKVPAAARAEAAAWIARMHGPQRSPELEDGLRRWLAEDSANARAFERMTEAWEAATAVSTTSRFPRINTWNRPAAPSWKRAASVVLACGIAAFAAHLWWSDPSYTTDVGEQRMVRLEDGSRVSLNSASRVVVQYEESQRRVRLDKGEAFFEVVSDPHRPFVVVAGARRVTALGTTFSVRYEPNQLAVMLVEGKVAISGVPSSTVAGSAHSNDAEHFKAPFISHTEGHAPSGHETSPPDVTAKPSDASAFVLAPGQRLILAAARPPQLDTPRVESVTAWRRGEVVLDKAVLADAVAEMNRYDETRLVIDDPHIASLLVSGIYRTGDSAGFARAISKMYDVAVSEEGDSIHLREEKGAEPD